MQRVMRHNINARTQVLKLVISVIRGNVTACTCLNQVVGNGMLRVSRVGFKDHGHMDASEYVSN